MKKVMDCLFEFNTVEERNNFFQLIKLHLPDVKTVSTHDCYHDDHKRCTNKVVIYDKTSDIIPVKQSL